MIVQKTRDYSQFKLFNENREIKKFTALKESIKRRNMLQYHPIHIDRNYYIVDGQHRLMAARDLGVDVYYVIDKDADVRDISTLNNCGVNWNIRDHLHHFCELKSNAYIFLRSLVTKYDMDAGILVTKFSKSCESSPGKSVHENFRNGDLTLRYEEWKCESICKNVSECIGIIKDHLSGRSCFQMLTLALLDVVTHAQYDHQRFIRKLHKYPGDVQAVAALRKRKSIYLELIERVYNKSEKSKDKIAPEKVNMKTVIENCKVFN